LAELQAGTDPNNPTDDDIDTDGLTDAHEDDLRTNRLKPDTDGGGVSDWAELDTHAWKERVWPVPVLSDPRVTEDDFGVDTDEIANCDVELTTDTAGTIATDPEIYRRYNLARNQGWVGFAYNDGSLSPNNDGRVAGDTWWGRRNSSKPDTQRFTVDGVDGVDGCYGSNPAGNASGNPAVNAMNFGSGIEENCILLIPVFSNQNPKGDAPRCQMSSAKSPCEFFVTKVLAFKVSKISDSHYEARLLDDYPTFGGSYPGWTRDSGGSVVIKLKDDRSAG